MMLKMNELDKKIEKIDERQRQLEIINTKLSLMIEMHENAINTSKKKIEVLEKKKMDAIDKIWWVAVATIIGSGITEIFQYFLR